MSEPMFQPSARVKIGTNEKSKTEQLRGLCPDTLFGVILQVLADGKYLVCFSMEDYLVEVTKYEHDLSPVNV